jgi:urease accessory protein
VLHVREILGDSREARFAGRAIERLPVACTDASKRRLRASTDAGTDVAVDLERGSYLRDGAVLADDGERIVVVERRPEEAMIVRFPAALEGQSLLAQAVRLGHAFGNQHVPLEIEDGRVLVPITTSPELAGETVHSLGLEGIEIEFGRVPLGRRRPLLGSGHQHG